MRLLTNVLEVIVEGCIKCCQVLSSCYKSTQLDFMNSRVDRVRLCIKVLEVVVVGVHKMSSSRVELLRVDMT